MYKLNFNRFVISKPFSLKINYDQSLTAMIQGVCTDGSCDDVTKNKFPFLEIGEVQLSAVLFIFKRLFRTEEIVGMIRILDFELPRIEHILALHQNANDVLKPCVAIPALASMCRGSDQMLSITVLFNRFKMIYLNLIHYRYNEWSKRCRFLALCPN